MNDSGETYRRRREQQWWAYAIAVYAVSFFVPLVVSILVLSMSPVGDPARAAAEVAIATAPIIGIVLGSGALVAIRAIGHRPSLLGWSWRGLRAEWRSILLGLAIAIAILVVDIAFEVLLGVFGVTIEPMAHFNAARQQAFLAAVLVISAVIIAPVGEELFYRGFVLTMFDRALARTRMTETAARWVAILAVAAFFSLTHLVIDAAFQLFVFAVMLGWARMRTGSLVAPVSAHAINNAISVSVLLAT